MSLWNLEIQNKIPPLKLDVGYLPQAIYFVQPPTLPIVSEFDQRKDFVDRNDIHRWSKQRHLRLGRF